MNKHRLNITIDEAMYTAHRLEHRSPSKYINQLLKDDFIRTHNGQLVDKIVEQTIARIKSDDEWIELLSTKLAQRAKLYDSVHEYDQTLT